MRTYRLRIKIEVYNPLVNDIDIERIVKQTLDADSDFYVKELTVIED